jgi:hypothetical protein
LSNICCSIVPLLMIIIYYCNMFIVETIEVLTRQSTSLSFKFQSRDHDTITDQGYKKFGLVIQHCQASLMFVIETVSQPMPLLQTIYQWPYSQHLVFFATYEWTVCAKMLNYTMFEFACQ